MRHWKIIRKWDRKRRGKSNSGFLHSITDKAKEPSMKLITGDSSFISYGSVK